MRPPPTQAAAQAARSLAGQSLPPSVLLVPPGLQEPRVQLGQPAPRGQLEQREPRVIPEPLAPPDQQDRPDQPELPAQLVLPDRQEPLDPQA